MTVVTFAAHDAKTGEKLTPARIQPTLARQDAEKLLKKGVAAVVHRVGEVRG